MRRGEPPVKHERQVRELLAFGGLKLANCMSA